MTTWHLALFAMILASSACGLAQTAETAVGIIDPTEFQVSPAQTSEPAPWGLKVITSLEQRSSRQPAQWANGLVGWTALDVRHAWQLGSQWRLTVSDRMELEAQAGGTSTSRNALRETYVSTELPHDWYLDAGRINLRPGVALGWNPSDWLREGSLGTATQSPVAARDNRLGAVMLRLQRHSEAGAIELAWLPRLRDPGGARLSDWGLNLDRGNAAQAMNVRVAPVISQAISLDMGAMFRQGQHPGWTTNLTAVLGPRWLALLEAQVQSRAGLKGPDQPAGQAQSAWRMAAGLSVTLDNGAVLGLEWHHAGDALSRSDWQAWRTAAATPQGAHALAALRSKRAMTMDPVVQDALFIRAQWNDVRSDGRLDASGLLRLNPYDHSHWAQIDLAWHLRPNWSLRLTGALTRGKPDTEHGFRAVHRLVSFSSEWHL